MRLIQLRRRGLPQLAMNDRYHIEYCQCLLKLDCCKISLVIPHIVFSKICTTHRSKRCASYSSEGGVCPSWPAALVTFTTSSDAQYVAPSEMLPLTYIAAQMLPKKVSFACELQNLLRRPICCRLSYVALNTYLSAIQIIASFYFWQRNIICLWASRSTNTLKMFNMLPPHVLCSYQLPIPQTGAANGHLICHFFFSHDRPEIVLLFQPLLW